MTTQWVITVLILIAALFYIVRRMAAYFRKSPGKQKDCKDFGGDCAACLKHRKS